MTRTPVAGYVLAATSLAALAAPAHAQDSGALVAGSTLEAGVKLSTLRGRAALLAGGTALLGLADRVRFGGGGWIVVGDRDFAGGGSGATRRLDVGYAGAVLAIDLPSSGPVRWGVRTLLGAGNARVELAASGTEIGTDNFLVVEPEATATVPFGGTGHARVGAGYRFVGGVDDLPGVEGRHVRGVTLTLSVGLGRGRGAATRSLSHPREGAIPSTAEGTRAPRHRRARAAGS